MKILHVLSQFEVTGAEAYAASLIEAQIADGHSVLVASDTFTLPTQATYIPVPIGIRSYSQRLKNIGTLVKLIRGNSIDTVHAHSRAASWVSFFATRITGRPLVSTVHGRQHVHASSKAFSVYGRDIIAVSAALKEHLIQDLGFNAHDIVVIPNCIPLARLEAERLASASSNDASEKNEQLLLFVGRLTGPKGDVVRFLLTKILPGLLAHRRLQFKAIGGMITPDDLPRLAQCLNDQIGRPVAELAGFQPDIARYLLQADLIIGSGRVVPESLVLRRPVIAFGESDYAGPILPGTFESASVTNFGDTGLPITPDPEKISGDILRILESPPSENDLEVLSRMAQKRFDTPNVGIRINAIYERAYARSHAPKSIPVLMYHRVLEQAAESAHGIWVSAGQFASQLGSLKRRGFQTITFHDYDRFLRGEVKLPTKPVILTFDDGYEDNYRVAFPLLQQHGFSAVVYAVTDRERRTNFWDQDEPAGQLMSAAQMQELHRCGIEIGSHTVTHPRLPRVTTDQAHFEISKSKDTLEQILGSSVLSFAYPYGELSEVVKDCVGEAGYTYAVAADSGPLTFYQDFLEIRRTQVFPWTDQIGFWKKTLPLYVRYKAIKS
ncbi:MAG: polysaccharide deacetylase family protein [Ignavibacteriales bacterium]|nr:polysaccharide deacetylase family protein [Ignavibacteriales bacterium]